MYLHLGQDKVIRTCDILGIFDLDNCTVSKRTKQYLARAQKENRVVNVTAELPKTFVVCASEDQKQATVYISQISSSTLKKRTHFIHDISNIR